MEVSCYIQKTCPWWNKSSAKKTALNLAREYYGDKNLKKRDVRPTKLVDFEGIARHHNVNIIYEPKKEDAGSMWQLACGNIQYKNDLPTINKGFLGGHCFLSKRWMYFAGDGSVKVVGRYLRETRIW